MRGGDERCVRRGGEPKPGGRERASFVARAKRSEKTRARPRQSATGATGFARKTPGRGRRRGRGRGRRAPSRGDARISREVRAHDERVDARGDGPVFAERERPDAASADGASDSSAEKFVILHDGEEVRVRGRERAQDADQTLRDVRRAPRERRGGPRPARVHPLGRVRERTVRR